MDARQITRRTALAATAGGVLGLLQGCASRPAPAQGTAAAGESLDALAAKVNRITWGVNDSAMAQAGRDGFDRYLRSQLKPSGAALPPQVQADIAAMTISRTPVDDLVRTVEEQRRAADAVADDEQKKVARQDYQKELNRIGRETASRHLLRALYSRDQVLEQMCWFWLNHFSVHQYKRDIRAMLADYEDRAIRPHALGRFRDLLGAVSRHPAMLRYLDNDRNSAGHINENYARELMELHTLGVDAGYAQSDVQELARVLTGVGVNGGLFEFHPRRHDAGPKQLLGRPIAGRGLAELDEALDRLARHPATARFISRKLAVFWMSDEPPAQIVNAMSEAFRSSDGDFARVLEAMFAAPEFWSARKFKDPMRYVMSALRLVYDERPMPNTGPVLNGLNRMGEPLYGRQTPDGYSLDSRAWNSAGQMATRFEIAKAIASSSAVRLPEWRASALSPNTRAALSQARSAQEWNTYLLSSPEFMER